MSSRGFSLIEILISIFIVSIVLVAIQAIARSGVLARNSKNQSIALSIARTELEILRRNGYASLSSGGTFSHVLLPDLPQASASFEVNDYNEKTKLVTTNVKWQDPGMSASSTVSLSTLVTEIGGLP